MSKWNWKLLRAGRLMLDGGSMFGVVPRVVWTRTVEPDAKNQIELSHNCVLLESAEVDPELGRVRRVVIETGTGDKLDPKMSKIFGLDGRTVEAAVIEAGVDVAEIDHVIVSHLHFDHAGGLTRRARDGEVADWVASEGEASGDCKEVKLTFPNAEVVVQEREWFGAIENTAVMTKTYYRDHLLPLNVTLGDGRERVRRVSSASPFMSGVVPRRGDVPSEPVSERMTEVLPGLRVFLVPGHTWGQQAIAFDAADGQTVVFVPDVLPTAWHVGQAYSLAYDVEPYTSMMSKAWLLQSAFEEGWTLVLDHEPGEAVRRVVSDGRGWYSLEAVSDGG